jgi:hypothetical protein
MYTNTIAPIRPIRLRPLAACLVPMLALSAPALAATAPPPSRATPAQIASSAVTSCADDGGFDTLRHAVLVANPGDSINLGGLPCSKITLQGAIVVGLDDLTIQGPGAGALTIDGNGNDRVFVHGGKGTFTIEGLTIANGMVATDKAIGGCIYSKGNVALTRSTLTSCKAIGQTLALGGGAVAYGDMTLDESTVSGNVADATVGQAQTAALGGGVVGLGQVNGLTLKHSVISGNTVHAASGSALGGGVGGFKITAKYSTITGNAAKAIGDASDYGAAGGIVALYSLSMAGSTVDHNEADLGGGIFVTDGGGFATIIQSTISANNGKLSVGGIGSGAPLSLANSTVAFNTGGPYGGGGVLVSGTATFQSSIVADNAPTDVDGSVVIDGTNNLIKIAGANTTVPMGTLTKDPMFLPLAFNGGTTRTHALEPASPAINAGNNVLNLSFDQRDTAYARVVGALPDMGAVEFDPDHIFGDRFGSP